MPDAPARRRSGSSTLTTRKQAGRMPRAATRTVHALEGHEAAAEAPLPGIARAATIAGVVAGLAVGAGWAVLLLP
ncbi:MAG: hypothetical protein ACTHJL_12640 [Amnibacterium sp.]